MKINRISANLTDLEKKQMLKIDELQNKIKLYEFDKTKDNAIIRDLKRTLANKKRSIREVIKEISKIQEEKNYEKIEEIRKWLQIIERQGDTNEEN